LFPISVDGAFGEHCLSAIRQLRSRFGPELRITGGMSNVSFGIPQRRLINDVFLVLDGPQARALAPSGAFGGDRADDALRPVFSAIDDADTVGRILRA